MLIIGTPGEFRDLFQDEEEIRNEVVLRPQCSGPCLSYGPHGCEIPCKSGEEREGCPHIDNPDVVCPIKDCLGTTTPASPLIDDGEGYTYSMYAATARRPRFRPGDKVQIRSLVIKGFAGQILKYFSTTENYLVAIEGTTKTIITKEGALEAL